MAEKVTRTPTPTVTPNPEAQIVSDALVASGSDSADEWGEYGEFTVETARKPIGGVTEAEIPAPLARMLAEHAPKALSDPDYELVLTAKDEATAKRLGLYARAWGARQEPRLRITKVPNRRDMGKNVARLSVAKEDDVPAENRPGRRANS